MKTINDKIQFVLGTGKFAASATDSQKAALSDAAFTIGLAIMPGHAPVMGVDNSSLEVHTHRVPLSLASKGVNLILDDMTATEKSDGGIVLVDETGAKNAYNSLATIIPAVSGLSLRSQIEYLRSNPRFVKRITIATANNAGLFDIASLTLADTNPFHQFATKEDDLNQYKSVNQYDDNKININYAQGDFQLNEDTFFAISGIPAWVEDQLTVTIEFYPEEDAE